MDFPPVMNLISATFNELSNRVPTPGTETLSAPQPTAESSNANSDSNQSFSSDFAESNSENVGRHLDAKA